MILPKKYLTLLFLLSPFIVETKNAFFSCKKLQPHEYNHYFNSNNPIKSFLFKKKISAFKLSVKNTSPYPITIESQKCTPSLIKPKEVASSLEQSKSAAPWILGAGWTILLITGLGFANIPSIVSGTTLIIAGLIGMNNNHLPSKTAQTIHNTLMDGIHTYTIPEYEEAEFILLFPYLSKKFSIIYNHNTKIHSQECKPDKLHQKN